MKYIRKIFRKKTVLQIYHFSLLVIAIIIGFIMKANKKYKGIWLISERYNEARDNGYHLFKYIRTNHPSLKVYYVIDKNSTDRSRVINYGNVIDFGSFKHYLYYVLSEKLISTHINGTAPDSRIFPLLNKFMPVRKKQAFLQHGITKDYLPQLSYDKVRLDLFVCGAKPEYEFVKRYFGYNGNQVRYLGFARFDSLHNYSVKGQILLMPTFRMWLFTDSKKTQKDYEKFIRSNYYETYQSLINNSKIIDLIEKNNLKLIFYPHYEIHGYLHLFSTTSKNIVIANSKDYDVQQLLKESKLLITDYSSVYFDFAYMKKPVIYYHFDYDEYRNKHYGKGYFDYERDGFGPIVRTEGELYNELSRFIYNDFKMDVHYKDRVDKFFPLNDTQNTKRNFDVIYKL